MFRNGVDSTSKDRRVEEAKHRMESTKQIVFWEEV